LDAFSYISPEQRVPQDHPLRSLRAMTDEALRGLQPRFNKLYSKTGRFSIAPEKLLRALLLQALHSVRSERMLMEQLDYNLLFRWFVGLNMDDTNWDVTVFTKNRERLLDGDIAEAFFQAVLQQARERSLLSDEHFTVDGTLLGLRTGLGLCRDKAASASSTAPRMQRLSGAQNSTPRCTNPCDDSRAVPARVRELRPIRVGDDFDGTMSRNNIPR
jgi:transposase